MKRALGAVRSVVGSLLLLLALSSASSGGARPDRDAAQVFRGDAVVGVDSLGRVLVAVDGRQSNGLVDFFAIFTASDRLQGPWSRALQQAVVVVKSDRISLVSAASSFALSLALRGSGPKADQPEGHFEVFLNHDGVELAQYPGESSVPLASLTALDIHSGWPDAFYYDVLAPATICAGDTDCTAGGCGSQSCSIGGCWAVPTSCSTNCVIGSFACCLCFPAQPTGYAQCRCRLCPQGC